MESIDWVSYLRSTTFESDEDVSTATFVIDDDVQERRDKVLAIIPHITGTLSMMGSGLIAIQIMRKTKRQGTMMSYHRLLFLMTAVDFVTSFGYALSRVPMPKSLIPGLEDRYGARGNEKTCTAQAFVLVFGISVAFLNVLLSCHYLAVIRWGTSERTIRKWLLPCISAAFVIALSLTLGLYFLDVLNYNPIFCFIGPDLQRCFEEGLGPTECNQRSHRVRKLLYFLPLWICIALITIIQTTIVWTVFSYGRRSSRWSRSYYSQQQQQGTRTTRTNNVDERTRKVAIQSLLYLASFYLAWTPFGIASYLAPTRVQQDALNNKQYSLALLVVTLQPMQGFFNCLAYFQTTIARQMRSVLACLTWRSSCRTKKKSTEDHGSSGNSQTSGAELPNDDDDDPEHIVDETREGNQQKDGRAEDRTEPDDVTTNVTLSEMYEE